MKILLRISFTFQLFFIQHLLSVAQEIPSERQVNWSAALSSYSYLIPSKEVNVMDFGAIGDGVHDDQPAVMSAIAALEGQLGYVSFPEGTYLMKNTVSLTDSVILKGDGAEVCELRFDLDQSNKNCISIDKPQNSEAISLHGGYSKESNMLYTDSAFIFDEGGYILIFQENGEWDDKPIGWAKNAVGQIVQIDEIIGDTLYLKSALRYNYNNTLNPQIKAITPISNSGVMCLKITRVDEPETGGGANIFIRYATNCFIRGIESDMSIGSHFDIFSSTNILIDGCYIHHAFLYNGASKHGYGITLNNQTGECLIIDNIFEHLRHAMMVKTGANGNVFAYNYSRDVHRSEWPNNYAGDISLHGHFANANLFEGNIVQNIFIDHYWGPSGPLNTFYRNRAESFGIIMTSGDPTTSDNQNFVGNEVTNSSFFYGNYMLTGSGHFQFGNNITGTIVPDGTDSLTLPSLFLDVAPAFWNINNNWPSIGFPNDPNVGSIPAKTRYDEGNQLTVCPDSLITTFQEISKPNGDFQLWPNPAENRVNLDTGETNMEIKEINLLTTKGQSIYKIETTKDQVSLNLDVIPQSGIYIVQLRTKKKLSMKKLLVFK